MKGVLVTSKSKQQKLLSLSQDPDLAMGGAHGGMPYKNIFGGQMCLGVMISLYMERPVKKTIPSGDSL